jgi:DNA polymerase-3 subunit epsilon
MKILFYDLETTGIDYKQDAIIQFAGILTEINEINNEISILDKFNYEMRPAAGKRIDLASLDINGYTLEQLKDFKSSNEIYIEFSNLLGKHCNKYNKLDKITLCGYNNLHFDNDFLRQWFIDNGDNYFGSWFWSNAIDVMSETGLYFLHYRPALNNFKLGTVAKFLDIETDDSALHDGFYDIKLTMKIFLKLLKSPKIKEWDEKEAERIFNIKIELDKLPKPVRKESEFMYMN